jgi:cell division protein FtsN
MQTQAPMAQPTSSPSDPPPITWAERRLTPRKAWVADINFEPNDGGIVLNLSEGGLGFRSIAPVQPDGPIRFWFSLDNQRVQASGELAWVDASQKTGGLRFTTLPSEAREQIRQWTMQPISPLATDDAPAGSARMLRRFFSLGSIRPDTPDTAETPVSSTPLSLLPRKPQSLMQWSWFTGGLALGALLSAFIASLFVFHTNRRQLGESIIHFGERIAARTPAQHQRVLPAPASPAADAISSPVIPVPQVTAPASQLATNSAGPPKPQLPQAKPESAPTTTAIPFVAPASRPKLPASADTSSIPVASLAISSPTIAAPSDSSLVPSKPNPGPPSVEPAKYVSAFIEPSATPNTDNTPTEMYFEVGRFKDELSAKGTKDKLAQLGFPAAVIHKSRLWSNAYRVVVGPYTDDAEAKIGQKSLVSRGFSPQPFERGSRDFNLSYALTLNGKSMPVGECIIRWESYSSNVVVQFIRGKDVAATVDAKWVKRAVHYDRPAFVYIKGGDGSRNLAEVRFAGMNRALVFHKSS